MRAMGAFWSARTARFIAIVALLGSGIVSPPEASQARNSSPAPGIPQAASSLSMEAITREDGSLALPPDFHGSIDPRGWSMTLDADGRPRFQRDPAGPSRTTTADSRNGAADPVTGAALGDDSNWDPRFRGGGPDAVVHAMAVDGATVYLGGYFLTAGPTVANFVVKYDAATGAFTPLGFGLDNFVFALTVANGQLYAGGRFKAACANALCTSKLPANGINRIAVWDGTAWSPLGNGFNADVEAIAIASNGVYAGGAFTLLCANADCSTTAPANGVNRVAFYNGSAWQALAKGVNDQVFAIALVGTVPYFGGSFDRACSNDSCSVLLPPSGLNNIASYSGGSYQPLAFGVNNAVFALAASGVSLIVGGGFDRTCSNAACAVNPASGVNRVAIYVGGVWAPLANGFDTTVRSLAVSGSTIYAGGDFTKTCTNADCSAKASNGTNGFAVYNGSTWAGQSFGFKVTAGNGVFAIGLSGNRVLAGGGFQLKCADAACTGTNIGTEYAAVSTGGAWAGLYQSSNSVNGGISALGIAGSDVYVGGAFGTAGFNRANNVARYNTATNTWSQLDRGLNDFVRALYVNGTKLIVGGDFTRACSASDCATVAAAAGLNHIAVWDGSAWSALGNGLDDAVNTITMIGTTIYAGGDFTQSCTNADCSTKSQNGVNRVARFNGASWAPLVDGLSFPVYALATDGTKLYAGGSFLQICASADCSLLGPGSGYNRIAVFNGSGWAPLGNGLSDIVQAIVVDGGTVYAGGRFARTCSVGNCLSVDPAAGLNYVAKWNGSAWSALGQGVNKPVIALALSGQTLYLTGTFTNDCADAACSSPGPTALQHIASFTAAGYSALGSGLSNSGDALAARGGDLFVGGGFRVAGAYPSIGLARWGERADLAVTMTASTGPIVTGVTMTFTSTVTNLGPATAMSVTLQNTLPAGAVFVSATPSAGSCASGPPILCTAGSLDPGGTFTVTVQAVAQTGGPNTDTSVVATLQTDSPPENNTATATISVVGSMYIPASAVTANVT